MNIFVTFINWMDRYYFIELVLAIYYVQLVSCVVTEGSSQSLNLMYCLNYWKDRRDLASDPRYCASFRDRFAGYSGFLICAQ